MNFIGVDLHKKSITVCVMDEKRKVLARKTLCGPPDNWQEVGQDIDSGPDRNPVAGRPVPEQEGRARPNRTKSL